MQLLCRALTVGATMLALAGTAAAQQADVDVNLDTLALDPRIVRQLETRPEATLESLLGRFFAVASNGAVSQELLDQRQDLKASQQRATHLRWYTTFDIDGDQVIEEEEVELLRRLLDHSSKARMLVLLTYADTDGDRQISFAEVSAFVDRRYAPRRSSSQPANSLMQFDLDRDGKVIAWEIIQIAKAIGARGPREERRRVTDRDIVLRPGDVAGFGRCGYRTVPGGEHVVLVTAEAGGALSGLSLGGADQVTTVGTLVIEKGREPVTLMLLNRRPMIWRLQGQVERVRQVIFSSRDTGVIGIPENRVRIVRQQNCLPAFFSVGAADVQDVAERQLSRTFPRAVISVLPQRRAISIAVPSGKARPVPLLPAPQVENRNGYRHIRINGRLVPVEGPNADPRQAALFSLGERVRRQYPLGLHRISDSAVRSARPGYRVTGKPAEMGLIDAIEAGRLEPLTGQRYRITPSFDRFPDGLPNGRFVLPAGLPVPLGLHPGLELRAEWSGACIAGSTCQP